MALKIKKGDTVQVISGRDAGKQGKVSQVFPRQHMVVVEGVNIRFKHARTRQKNEMGQRIQFAAPLIIDKVQLVCPHCNQPARLAIKDSEQGRTRMCKKCYQAV